MHVQMLEAFKTVRCLRHLDAVSEQHNRRRCEFYHDEQDRRRPTSIGDEEQLNYLAVPCDAQFDDLRRCPRGDSCGKCHNTTELLYHPTCFRKRFCRDVKCCPRSAFCAFAHSQDELAVPHLAEPTDTEARSSEFHVQKFKTQWCPIAGTHDWESCD